MRSHLSRLSFSIDVQCHAYKTLETILAIHGKNWLEFYYRERRREKKGGKTYSRRAAYGATSEASLSLSPSLSHSHTAFEVSGMKEAAVLEFTWLLCLPLGPEDSLRGYPSLAPLLPSSSFRRDLTHETSYNPSFYPSGVPRSCLLESRNDYRYGRRWPNIRVNPSVELEMLPMRTSERKNRNFFQNISRNWSRPNAL